MALTQKSAIIGDFLEKSHSFPPVPGVARYFSIFSTRKGREKSLMLHSLHCHHHYQLRHQLRRLVSTFSLGKPTASLVAPGNCVLTEDWTPLPLFSKKTINHDTTVYKFSLLDAKNPLNLSTCACVLASIPDSTGELVVRPYTPISTNADIGFMELMVKKYSDGIISTHLDNLNAGDTMNFKHIPFNVKIQAPFNVKKIGMLVGGTGVAPMIQALHAILGAADATEVTLLYGSKTQQDILAQEQLDEWASESNGKLVVHHVLSEEPDGSDWKGRRGFIDEKKIQETLPSSDDDDSLIFVCGSPAMYDMLCGERTEKEITGILGKMGYSNDVVHKF